MKCDYFMKKKILLTILVLLLFLLLIPMPHGGTIGSNLFEGLLYEVKTYFSSEAKQARDKENKEWELQKEETRKSWEKFKESQQQLNVEIYNKVEFNYKKNKPIEVFMP